MMLNRNSKMRSKNASKSSPPILKRREGPRRFVSNENVKLQ